MLALSAKLLIAVEYVRGVPVRVKVTGEWVTRGDGNVFVLHWNDKSDGMQHHAAWRRILTIAVHVVADDAMSQRAAVHTQLVSSTCDTRTHKHIFKFHKVV